MIRALGIVLALCAGVATADAPRRTYANPVDVDYRYNFEQVNEQISYRTGADPVIVRHKDAYYLFMTLADGYWRSTNLLDWTLHHAEPLAGRERRRAGGHLGWRPPDPDAVHHAPRVPILMSRDPAHGQMDFLTRRMPELPGAVSGPGRGEAARLAPG